ncbi:MAG: sodium:alanine symporter family protein [Firmicutes bacterium]|nr:sodium:alanine symporter family protein [Bacillota bacterium]
MGFTEFLDKVDGIVWGVPMLVLLVGTGIYLSIRLGLLQFRKLGISAKYMLGKEPGISGQGEISSFQAFCVAMSATIGTGNIVGVATAVVVGGPGALFWMVFAACVGMITKYAECLLAVKYRDIGPDGHTLGGPFLSIEKGMGKQWTWLAKLFAFLAALAGIMGIGTIVQINGIASAVSTFFDPDSVHTISMFGNSYTIATVATAVIVTFFAALVIIGGITRIGTVTSYIVPVMAVVYIVACLIVLICNLGAIPGAIADVFAGAFGLRAAAGGALGAFMLAIQKGVARGVFSNEAGLGSAPMAVATANTNEPVRQGLINSFGVFIDTIIICNLTGLSILVTGAHLTGKEGAAVTIHALGTGMPFGMQVGAFVLMACLALFAFTTILGWDIYGERSLEYLFNGSMGPVKVYRILYILAVLIGPFLTVSQVWTIADIFNGLMAIPNLVCILALSGVVAKETKDYFNRLENGLDDGIRRK